MRCAAVCILLFASAVSASAQSAQPASGEPPVCTTVTNVVKRGEVVLSTSSRTTCEGAKGEGLKAPQAMLAAPAEALASVFGGSGELKPRQVRGEWRSISPGADRVCHVVLMQETTGLGRKVRTTNCPRPPLSRAEAWKLEDNAVDLYGKGGALLVRLTGDPARLSGPGVTLER